MLGAVPRPVHAEMRDFTNAKGAIIRAELKKARGQMIFLRKEDNKEIQVPLNQFSKDDQTFILKWMTEDPTALDYNFGVKLEVKNVPSTKKVNNSYYQRLSAVLQSYTINIQNSSRNTLDDLSVDWCAFMMNNVAFSNSSSSSRYGIESSNDGLGELRFKHGTYEISKMAASHTANFATPNFTVESIIDKYYTGAKVKDKLQGVWLRFYRGDTLIQEWKSPDCPKMDWPAGEHKSKPKVEIASEENKPPKKAPPTVKPTTGDKPAAGDDDEMGDIVKIFELEDKK